MKNEIFWSCRVSLEGESVPMAELLSGKNIKTVDINFRVAKRLKEIVVIGGYGRMKGWYV